MSRIILWSLVLSCLGGGVNGFVSDASAEAATRQVQTQAQEDTTQGLEYDMGVAAGLSQINERGGTSSYATLRLLPEIYYRDLGIGLLANVRVNPRSGGFREEDYDDFRDYLALIYFLEYGEDEDSLSYGRFGSIEETSLSYGLFVERYTNAHRLDEPMRGLTGAYTTRKFRFDGMYADLASPGVFGIHTAYLPFGVRDSSLLSRLSVGVAFAGDLNKEGALVNPSDPGEPFLIDRSLSQIETSGVPIGVEDGPLFMIGVDAGVRWFETKSVSMLSFVEAAKIFEYGIGASLGIQGAARVGRLRLQTSYAQRILGKEFLPDYFGSTYEAERLREVSLPIGEGREISAVNTRRNKLAGRQSVGTGYHLQVRAEYEDVFDSTVGYETIWGEANTDRFTLDFELRTAEFPMSIRVGYDRFDMSSLNDVFDLFGQDVLYRLGLAYEILGPLRLGLEIRQTFEPVYQNGRTVGQTKQTRIEPLAHLVLRL